MGFLELRRQCGVSHEVRWGAQGASHVVPGYAGQEATVRTRHGTTDWFQIRKGICQGCILSPCLLNLYAEYIMRNAGLEEAQAGIKIARRNINNLRYADDPTLMAESEELRSLLMNQNLKGKGKGSRSVVSDSSRPHGLQPTRLPCPWDSPGKNTGVGCHFLLRCIKVKSQSEVAQSCGGTRLHGGWPELKWGGRSRGHTAARDQCGSALRSRSSLRSSWHSGRPLPSCVW